jgi:hypothetical protein
MLQTQTSIMLGGVNDIEEFAKRIKTMMRGGEKLTNQDALSLAQFAKVTGLNPFIGECWWISGSGAMVGIAGARRLDQERAADQGGYSFPTIIACDAIEAGASEVEVKDVAAAFKVEIHDSAATSKYQKLFTETIQAMREAGVSDPFAAAKEVCGPRPVWTGYGFAKRNEPSRMSKVQLARKRAEADGLKKRIVIPFGAQVAESDVSPEYVDASDAGFTDAEKHHEIGMGKLDEEYPQSQELVIESAVPAALKTSKAISEKPNGVIGWLLEEQHIDNVSHAASIANLLKLTDPKLIKKDWERRCSNYRSLRDSGLSEHDAAVQAISKELGF